MAKILKGVCLSAILLCALLVLASCQSPTKSKRERAEIANMAEGPITIAVAWPLFEGRRHLLGGVILAVDEINRAGGIMGRELNFIAFDTAGKDAYQVARKIAKNKNIVAVIGHYNSAEAIEASITYEENGILFLAPSATNPTLTAHGFKYVFRLTPSDRLIGKNIARFTHRMGYRKVVILDDNSIYGAALADTYYSKAVDLQIKVVTHKAYFTWQTDYRPLISDFAKLDFDAVFIAGHMPNAAFMIKQFYEMGINKPFIGGDSLDNIRLFAIAGPAAHGTVIPTVFSPFDDAPIVRTFVEQFEKRFNKTPETWDALGYDAIKLLAYSIKKSHSTVPIVISATLHFTTDWRGVTGAFTFDANGELKDKKMHFKQVYNDRFEYIEE